MTSNLSQIQSTKCPAPHLREQCLVPHTVFATAIVVFTEIMFFTALISAYLVIKESARSWLPPANIRLPVLATALNTLILVFSGLCLFLSSRAFKKNSVSTVRKWQLRAILAGATFVIIQGSEWIRLMSYGMTMNKGIFSALFYLLIGTHALHALIGIFVLIWGYWCLLRQKLTNDVLLSIQMFWFFIVGVWPILYALVYF